MVRKGSSVRVRHWAWRTLRARSRPLATPQPDRPGYSDRPSPRGRQPTWLRSGLSGDTAPVVPSPRIVLVEDDAELRVALARGLGEEGFGVTATGTGAEALEVTTRDAPDALVVDIGLPDTDGRDLCQALRASGVQAPVLFLTARDAVTDRVSGFGAGGDDYLVKPFDFAELIARLQALLRRSGRDSSIRMLGLRLDPIVHAASSGDGVVKLTPTEFRLLAVLAARPGDAVRRGELLRAAWPHEAIVHDNTLDVYVARLRRKLGELPDAPQITTVRGIGYSLA
jgi:two-component system OmpR family response regulator